MAPRATYRFTSQPTAAYKSNTPHHFSANVKPTEPYEGGKWEVALLDVTFPKRRNPVPVVNLWSADVYDKLKQIHSGILLGHALKDQARVPWSHIVDYFKNYLDENFFVFRIEFLYFFKYVQGRATSSTAAYKWDGKGVTIKDVRDRTTDAYVTGVDFIKWCIETTFKKIVENSPGSATVGGAVMDKCVLKDYCPTFEWDGEDLISQVKSQTMPLDYQPSSLTERNAKTLRVLWSDDLANDLGWCDFAGHHLGVNASYNTSWDSYYIDSTGFGPGQRCWYKSSFPGNTHSGNALQPVMLLPGEKLTDFTGHILYGKRRYSMLRGNDGLDPTFKDSVAFQKEGVGRQFMIHFPTSYEWRFRDINAAFWQTMGAPKPITDPDASNVLDDYQNQDFHIEITSNVVENQVLARVPYERYSEKQFQHNEMDQKERKPVTGFTLSHVNFGLMRSDTGQFYEEYQKKDVTFTPMFTSICLGFRKV